MKSIVIGKLADSLGSICQVDAVQGRHGPELVRTFSTWSSDDYALNQPERIPLDWQHGRDVGQVIFLQRGHGALWAVAEVDHLEELPTLENLSFSPEASRDGWDRIVLEKLALTDDPATCAIGNVTFIPGTPHDILRRARQQVPQYDLVKAAVEHRSGTTRLVDLDAAPERTGADRQPELVGRSYGRGNTSTGKYMVVDGQRLPVEHTAAYFAPVTVR